MKLRNILLLLVVTASSVVMAQQPITRTTTAQGEIEGLIENDLGTFKGVPFAQPPVGD